MAGVEYDMTGFSSADVDSSGNITLGEYLDFMYGRPGLGLEVSIQRFHKYACLFVGRLFVDQ